jgi:hypothetical protein
VMCRHAASEAGIFAPGKTAAVSKSTGE